MKTLDSRKNQNRELCSTRDEGKPFGIGLQDQVSNHLRVMRIKSACGERLRKRWSKRLHKASLDYSLSLGYKLLELIGLIPIKRHRCKFR